MTVGYRGTRELIFDLANLIIADREDNRQPTPDTWRITDNGLHVVPPRPN